MWVSKITNKPPGSREFKFHEKHISYQKFLKLTWVLIPIWASIIQSKVTKDTPVYDI